MWQFLSRPSILSTFLSRPLHLVYFQHNGIRTAHIPTTCVSLALRGTTDSIQDLAESCHTHIGSFQHSQERWYASIIGFLGTEGFKQWQHLNISKKDDEKKHPENVFKAFTDTLEVSTSQWNYINEMYSDIRQGEQETTDQLDQHIKILVERCGYMSLEEKTQCQLELLFHATKHFKVKKWVRSQTALNKTVTFNKLLQCAKQHEATIKDFQ